MENQRVGLSIAKSSQMEPEVPLVTTEAEALQLASESTSLSTGSSQAFAYTAGALLVVGAAGLAFKKCLRANKAKK